ncbi:MAG TPA: glycosyltransferase family 1 protein [bacterium]|nr:glycosyltransferase family 1 protein [bacterium]
MRIGIDAISLDEAGAGVSRYVREILTGMMAISPGDEFVLYSWQTIYLSAAGDNWHRRVARGRRWAVPGDWLRYTLPKMVADDGIDVFWGQNTVVPLRLRQPCRRVLTVHDMSGFVVPRTMEIKARLSWKSDLRAAVKVADSIVADSDATARLVRRFLGVPRERVTVVYAGCSSRLTAASTSAVQKDTASRLGLPDEYVLTVGTLEPRKNHATLLEAIRRNSAIPPLVIVGAVGWNSRGILSLVRDAERNGRARYLGRIDDEELAAVYRAARIMVYPSLYEGFGLPVLEAMSCGCPVLCSWSSSMPEVGGRAACYFRPKDALGLADKLQQLLSDDRRLAEMRAKGIEQAAKFSFDRASGKTLDVLHGVPQVR